MREIKFKQAITDNQTGEIRWHYWGYLHIDTAGCPVFINPFAAVEWDDRPSFQFTGLKDKNGADLDWWKGDIIEFSYQHGFIGALQTETVIGVITFEQGQYWIDKYPIQRAIDEYGHKIGNVYENPELLKD